MSTLGPLRFQPILRDYLWGGTRLATELHRPLGALARAAESWEIVDHGTDQSVVAGGEHAGKTLHQLVRESGSTLLGRYAPLAQFPLLFKFLDCCQTLSVQVHPNDAQAAKLSPPDLGKTEAWYIVAAEPGSKVYAGLKPGVDRPALERAVAEGTCDQCLHSFEPQAGDCILIEAGTVHALGAGLLVAEIQQASDTTYRLFDWNRVDRDGKPRELHVRQSLETIDFRRGPVEAVVPKLAEEPNVERLVACDKFVLDRRSVDDSQMLVTGDRFHILAVIEGSVSLRGGMETFSLERGDTVLLPATAPPAEIVGQGRATILDMYLP